MERLPHRRKSAGIAAGTERRRSEMKWTEITGVDKKVDFKIKSLSGIYRIVEQPTGFQRVVFVLPTGELTGVSEWVYDEIIHAAPSGIIHLPPPLTDEQREQLKAIWTLGYRWLAKNSDNNVYAYGNIKPIKECGGWGISNFEFARIHEWMPEGVVASLVSWSDHEPFDIAKALGVGE